MLEEPHLLVAHSMFGRLQKWQLALYFINTCLRYSPNDCISHAAAAIVMTNHFTYNFEMMTSKCRAWLHEASPKVHVW